MWRVACEDANSKLVEVITVADVDAEKHVDDSFMLNLGHKAKFCSDFERKFGQEFELEVQAKF